MTSEFASIDSRAVTALDISDPRMTLIFLKHRVCHCCKSQCALLCALAYLVTMVPAWLRLVGLGTMFCGLASGYTSYFCLGTTGNLVGFGARALSELVFLPWVQSHCSPAGSVSSASLFQ